MKNSRNKYKSLAVLSRLSAALLVLTFFSQCNKKDLSLVNPNALTTTSFWKTEADAVSGVNAAYASLLVDGGYMRMTPCILDIRGDDVRSNSPWTAFSNCGRFALGTADGAGYGWAFASYYAGIFTANQVLDNVPAIDMPSDEKNRVLGQAYFLRGLYYFHLVNMFGKVALPVHAGVIYTPQSTVDQGWKQVIADFSQAASLLPLSYANVTGLDANQAGRATKGAALGYLGKTYLFNHRFDSAAAIFKQVIDLGVYSLVPNYIDNFTETNENNAESLFEVQFSRDAGGTALGWGGTPDPTWGKTSARAIGYAARAFGWTDVQPTFSVFNEFHQEKNVAGKVDPRLLVTIFYNDTVDTHAASTPMYQTTWQKQYTGDPNNFNDIFTKKYENYFGDRPDEYDWRSGINERLLRYADILLMYAECENELGFPAEAAKYIQMVRSRPSVNLPDRQAEFATYSQQQLRDQLAHERLLEFCMEGHRFDDINRWGWLKDPAKLAELKVRDPEFVSYIPGKELFPIPQYEMDNNPGFVQNPTY
ncbi:MAG TPA: RagB/SusD family nutrient uptake outer membrane protein [Puia sp.]|nr:RagB/SusD family nutrient uptake outer membrane protein [Puia sp.]